MKKVTLKQIAELADTSIGTVDRALNGRGRINEVTKQKILQIADELGYRPNKLASNLSRNKQLHLGILYQPEAISRVSYLMPDIVSSLICGRPQIIWRSTVTM